MNVNTDSAVSAAQSYEPAAKSSVSYAPEEKGKEDSITPKDSVDISNAAEAASEKAKGKKDHWKDFDMDAFQGNIRSTLMESINKSKEALRAGGVGFAKYNSDSILYDLSGMDDVKAADVPEYWNAENTSQRIFDFAMSFRELAPELSDEEYVKQMRDAVELGYKLAKRDLGDLPGPSAKLYNDTYSLTMQKFDEWLEKAKKGTETSV